MRWRLWPLGAAAPSSASAPGDGPRGATREWASLPSIQRSVGTPHLTAESVTFVRALPGRRPLDVAVARLGHVRSREAPAGLLVARAMAAGDRPAPRILDLLLLRPLRRAPVSQRAVEEAENSAVLEPPSDTEGGPESESPAPAAQAPSAVVPRLARVVPVPERIAPEAPSLTQAPGIEAEPALTQPELESGLVEPPAAPAAPKVVEGAPRLNLGQSRRLGLGLRPSPELPLAQRQALAGEPQPPEDQPAGSLDPIQGAQPAEQPHAEVSAGLTPGAVELGPAARTAPVLQRRHGQVTAPAGPVETTRVGAEPNEGAAGSPPPVAPPAVSPRPDAPPPAPPAGSRMTKPIMRVQRRTADAPAEPSGPGGTSTPVPGSPESAAMPTGAPPSVSRHVTFPLAVPPVPAPQEAPESPASRAMETRATTPAAGEVAGEPADGQGEPDAPDSGSAPPGVAPPLVFRATVAGEATGAPEEAGLGPSVSPRPGVAPALVSRFEGGETTPSPAAEVRPVPSGSQGVPGATPSRGAGPDVPPPLILRAPMAEAASSPAQDVIARLSSERPAASGPSVDDVAPIAGHGQPPPLPPLLRSEAVDEAGDSGEVQRALPGPAGTEPPAPLVFRAAGAGTKMPSTDAVQVLPLTGSRPPLVSPLGPQARLPVQRQPDDAPLVAPLGNASPGPAAVDGPWPAVRSMLEPPVPAPGRPARSSIPVQALSWPGTPSLPSLPAAPDLTSLVPRPAAAAPAELVRNAETLRDAGADAAAGGLRSMRHAAESMAGEVGAAGHALGSAAGQEVAAAQQAVHHAAGQAGLPGSEAEVDALAGRLYDRIRSRLRSELLIGRERAGQITDLR